LIQYRLESAAKTRKHESPDSFRDFVISWQRTTVPKRRQQAASWQTVAVSRVALLVCVSVACGLCAASLFCRTLSAADALPRLTQPVNDFAHVVDPASALEMERMIRALQAATGDVVVVATVPTIEPYGDINEYAVRLFENGGAGIGEKGKDNGALILLALKERRVRIEVGYGLEPWITDGFAGETSRELMAPQFRAGRYGAGLLAGTERIVGRIAQGRGVALQGVRAPQAPARQPTGGAPIPLGVILVAVIIILIVSRIGGGRGRGMRYWGGGPWSGWSSGVGPFGGGWGGGSGGGGFGGGFGGFGGGRSGGGGGGGSW
jgi:uncharacterized protein